MNKTTFKKTVLAVALAGLLAVPAAQATSLLPPPIRISDQHGFYAGTYQPGHLTRPDGTVLREGKSFVTKPGKTGIEVIFLQRPKDAEGYVFREHHITTFMETTTDVGISWAQDVLVGWAAYAPVAGTIGFAEAVLGEGSIIGDALGTTNMTSSGKNVKRSVDAAMALVKFFGDVKQGDKALIDSFNESIGREMISLVADFNKEGGYVKGPGIKGVGNKILIHGKPLMFVGDLLNELSDNMDKTRVHYLFAIKEITNNFYELLRDTESIIYDNAVKADEKMLALENFERKKDVLFRHLQAHKTNLESFYTKGINVGAGTRKTLVNRMAEMIGASSELDTLAVSYKHWIAEEQVIAFYDVLAEYGPAHANAELAAWTDQYRDDLFEHKRKFDEQAVRAEITRMIDKWKADVAKTLPNRIKTGEWAGGMIGVSRDANAHGGCSRPGR